MAGFSSPQQERGEPASVADDVYGVGAVLAFASTGTRPPDARLRAPDVALAPAVPAVLEDVVRRCLERDPERRFPTATELEAALAAAAGSSERTG
jgi:serine/threonine protein kinase